MLRPLTYDQGPSILESFAVSFAEDSSLLQKKEPRSPLQKILDSCLAPFSYLDYVGSAIEKPLQKMTLLCNFKNHALKYITLSIGYLYNRHRQHSLCPPLSPLNMWKTTYDCLLTKNYYQARLNLYSMLEKTQEGEKLKEDFENILWSLLQKKLAPSTADANAYFACLYGITILLYTRQHILQNTIHPDQALRQIEIAQGWLKKQNKEELIQFNANLLIDHLKSICSGEQKCKDYLFNNYYFPSTKKSASLLYLHHSIIYFKHFPDFYTQSGSTHRLTDSVLKIAKIPRNLKRSLEKDTVDPFLYSVCQQLSQTRSILEIMRQMKKIPESKIEVLKTACFISTSLEQRCDPALAFITSLYKEAFTDLTISGPL